MIYKVPAHLLPAITTIKNEYEAHLSALLNEPVKLKTSIYKIVLEPDFIANLVCTHFAVSWWQVTSEARHRDIVSARQAYCYLCDLHLNQKYPDIAAAIQRHRSTVSTSIKVVRKFLEVTDPYFMIRMRFITNEINQFKNDATPVQNQI